MPTEIHTCARCGSDTVSIPRPAEEPAPDGKGRVRTTRVCTSPPEWCEVHHLIGREHIERGLIETKAARELEV